ncbi:unnamed protein product [Polarella glacialis]|uniref:Uncharacterized protein n=1 Tax=Polarella glacialis TaxID=89957 RepID=A0A813JGT6_POLGL|nr:unnamed protein product [Polarella glacialis]
MPLSIAQLAGVLAADINENYQELTLRLFNQLCAAILVRRSDGGLLFALPAAVIPDELLDAAAAADYPDMLGPFLRGEAGIRHGATLRPRQPALLASVVLIDLPLTILDNLMLYDADHVDPELLPFAYVKSRPAWPLQADLFSLMETLLAGEVPGRLDGYVTALEELSAAAVNFATGPAAAVVMAGSGAASSGPAPLAADPFAQLLAISQATAASVQQLVGRIATLEKTKKRPAVGAQEAVGPPVGQGAGRGVRAAPQLFEEGARAGLTAGQIAKLAALSGQGLSV